MGKIFGKWTLFEILFLSFSVIAITLCFALGIDKNVFSYIVSLVGIVSVIMIAKGLVIAPMINLVYCVLYSILSIFQHYYGEAIIYIGLMMPIYVFSIISWIKNRNKDRQDVVSINKIKGMEYLYLSLVTIAATVGFYFLLKAMNTSELIISTLSLISSAVASYLMLRRCSYYAIGFIVNDIILIALWSMVVVSNGMGYLPSVLCFCIFLINDVYGFIHWKIEEHRQGKSENISQQ